MSDKKTKEFDPTKLQFADYGFLFFAVFFMAICIAYIVLHLIEDFF